MRIAMLVPGLAPHDAVSNDALGMTAALRAQGHEVALFSPSVRGIDEAVQEPGTIEAWLRSSEDVVLYHYCVGWDLPLALFGRTRARRVLRYHNITPPEFFEGWSEGYVAACSDGRRQLDAYAAMGCELYLGDSPYNLEDFIQRDVPATRCAVLPPFHEIEQLRTLEADARRLPAGAPLLLMVGRISPNKAYFDLVDALAAAVATAPHAHLLLVGKLDPNLARYGDAFRQRVAARGLDGHITWLQDANGAELRAAFDRADALVMLSEHEGFCVPVVEAMALGTPVVARASSALPWTVGDAGLVWDSADPHLVAASVLRIARDGELRDGLRQRGRRRYDDTFAPPVLEARLAEALRRIGTR